MRTSTLKKSVPVWALAATAALALPLLDPLTRARFVNDLVITWGFPVLLLAVAIGGTWVAAMKSTKWVVPVVIGVLGLAGMIGYGTARSYNTALSYASTVHDVFSQAMPALKERAPYTVAERQASSNLAGINGQISGTDYLADSNRYSTLVDRRGTGNPGYVAIINQSIQLTGQATGKPCLFAEKATQRMDGWFGNSLTRTIAAHDSLLIAVKEDAWGYCDGDTPKVVVPVTKLNGWINPVHIPAGVAIYDGKTGSVEIHDEITPGDLPGPAIGLSYVERVNASLATRGGDWWTMVNGQSGISDELKDDNDPNKDNSTAFSLAKKDQPGSVYASPFTSRASSRSIEHVALLESGHVKAGQSPSVSLYQLEVPRQSNSATADKLKADYSTVAWSTGLAVQEIIPVSHDTWAASIGLNQNVVYRVLVKDDGSSCLMQDGKTVRCVDDKGQPVGGSSPGNEGGSYSTVPGEVGSLSNEGLADLQNAVTAEVLKRLSQK